MCVENRCIGVFYLRFSETLTLRLIILKKLCMVIENITKRLPIIFPLHPRTKARLEEHGLLTLMESINGLVLVAPLGYVEFMSLVFDCRFVITDSGGIQEETTYLGIPCRTVRDNTERPVTVTLGTNKLCKVEQLENEVDCILSESVTVPTPIEFWDGHVADRVADSIFKLCHQS